MKTPLYSKQISKTRMAVFTEVNNFRLGEIDLITKTFHSVKRGPKNIFHLYGEGLGLDATLLAEYNFQYIEIPFNGSILKTTKAKWIRKGIHSPYSSGRVNSQVIMRLSDINMDDDAETSTIQLINSVSSHPRPIQMNLFGEA